MQIAYDREASSELEAKYFVYEETEYRSVIYKGTYTQCLVVVGAVSLDYNITLAEIKEKTNGFI